MVVASVRLYIGGKASFAAAAIDAVRHIGANAPWALSLTALEAPLVESAQVAPPEERQQTFIGLVTDANPDRDADGTYALHCLRIPVLSFAPTAATHPMLTTANTTEMDAPLRAWLTFPSTEGRIFVVEGGDGAGKQTQVALMVQRLRAEGYLASTLDYPHDAAHCGALIRKALSGRLGSLRSMHPLLFASLYGMNRLDTLPLLSLWIQRGHNVILDRYLTANFGHQASKCDGDDERRAAIDLLWRFEIEWLGLPTPHRVVYLDLPPEAAWRAMLEDGTRRELDIHERAGLDYKDKVRQSFLWCCSTYGWDRVGCMDGAVRRTREEVHSQIFERWRGDFVNRGDSIATS